MSDQLTPRGLPMIAIALATTLVLLTACDLVIGDDNDVSTPGPARGMGGGSTPIVSTFTPTVPGSTPEVIQTAASRSTQRAASATYESANPQVTATVPAGFPTPSGETLSPPKALLSDGVGSIESTEGSYSWVYLENEPPTYARIDVPLMPFTDVALTTSRDDFNIIIQAVDHSITGITIEAYAFEANTAIPIDQTGQPSGTLMFSMKEAPVAQTSATALGQDFTLELTSGHYLVVARVDWPDYVYQPPNAAAQTFPIYITYIFNLIAE